MKDLQYYIQDNIQDYAEYVDEGLDITKDTEIDTSPLINIEDGQKCLFTEKERAYIIDKFAGFLEPMLTRNGNIKVVYDKSCNFRTDTYFHMSKASGYHKGYYARVMRAGADRMSKLGLYDTAEETADRIYEYANFYLKKHKH